jgi:uncharacterized protein (TIGR02271 family)
VTAIWTDHNGQPAFLGVRTAWLFGKTHIVPAYGAQVNQQDERIRLPYLTEDVKNAPSYDPDAELDHNIEREVFTYYRERGPRLPEMEPSRAMGQQETRTGETSTGATETMRTRERGTTSEETRIPLHEEHLKVGKREVEAGGIRLRKIIRTETVNQPVEVQREDIVVERVPASEARSTRPQDRSFENQELYIPLRREEAVVEKETHVREEVRARKTRKTERQNVSGQVRKEDVEIRKGTGTEHPHHD